MGDLTKVRLQPPAAAGVAWVGARCFGVGLLLAAVGCASGVGCPGDLKYALLVNVTDKSGAQVCDVEVRAARSGTDGVQTLKLADCRFSGGTSAGRYTLVVEREEQEVATANVIVENDECGVVTKEVTITVPDP